MILVDSSVWIDYLRGTETRQTNCLDGLLGTEPLAIGDLILTEVLQGTTTDTAHALVTREMTREGLYVASTRGRAGTHWYVATESSLEVDCDHEPDAPRTAVEVVSSVLRRTGSETSATATLRDVQDEATSLATLVKRYDHARSVASLDTLAAVLEPVSFGERSQLQHTDSLTALDRMVDAVVADPVADQGPAAL